MCNVRYDGGINADDVPINLPSQQLQDLATSYYKTKVEVGPNQRKIIELSTAQHSCGDDNAMVLWKTRRRMHITSSNTGKIAKRRASTPVGRQVQQLLYSTFQGNKATAWGLSQEEASSVHYMEWLQEQSPAATVTINCGLVISPAYPWLAATPDGWVEDPQATPTRGIVEFKNPHSYKDSSIDDAITQKSVPVCLSAVERDR